MTSSIIYPLEPEYGDLSLINKSYTNIDTVKNLIKWREVWEKRLKETSDLWHARPRMCQLHYEAVVAEITKRENQTTSSNEQEKESPSRR